MARLLIWAVFIFGGITGGILIDLKMFRTLFSSIMFHVASSIIGLVLLRIVMIISRNTGRYLAKYGRNGEIPRLTTNVLVTTGVYGCMRHPMHFGLMFFPLSFALLMGSPSFIFFIAPGEMLLMVVMIKLIEKPEAIRKFGEDYLEYMKKVPMFSLKPECLKLLFKKV